MTTLIQRQHRGRLAYQAGMAAENQVAQDYEKRGFIVDHMRWRGKSGEIDLVVRNDIGLVFVEVKKSSNFARAAESLGPRQMHRLYYAAEEFLAGYPSGLSTNTRFDVALVDGAGKIQIIENAFGQG